MATLAGNYIRLEWMNEQTNSLMLTPDGHFIRKVESPTGKWSYEGEVEWRADVLRLPRSPDVIGRGIIDPEAEGSYRVVEWGERTYLIEDAFMSRFCNAVNAGVEPRGYPEGWYFLRKGDWLKPVSGLPKLPAPWTELLLASPLEGHVEELASDGSAWIGLGWDDGLRPGVLLTVRGVPRSQEFIELGGPPTQDVTIEPVTIEPHRSLVRQYLRELRFPIAVGMRVTSGAIVLR